MTKLAESLLKPVKRDVLSKHELPSLESVIEECTQSKAKWGLLQNDFVFALAFWSMIESGFESISPEKILPKNWKHETRRIYEAHFVLPPYSNCPVRLVAFPIGEILCINALASNVSSKNVNLKSLAIYSPGYVPRPDEDAVMCKFSELGNFHFLLKNVMIWPIRCSILTDQGVLNGSLCGVSDEIKLNIVRFLPLRDILMLSQTCRDLNRICNDQGLWKRIYLERFKKDSESEEDGEKCEEAGIWKENFREAYLRAKRQAATGGSPSESFHTSPTGPYGSEINFDID